MKQGISKLKSLRLSYMISQQQMAKKIGISKRLYCYLEQGDYDHQISFKVFNKLEKFFDKEDE